MINSGRMLGITYLHKDTYVCTIPKKIRDELITDNKKKLKTVSFFEEENGTISIGLSGNNVIGTAEFTLPLYQITIPRLVRKKLHLKKGGTLSFRKGENTNKIIVKAE